MRQQLRKLSSDPPCNLCDQGLTTLAEGCSPWRCMQVRSGFQRLRKDMRSSEEGKGFGKYPRNLCLCTCSLEEPDHCMDCSVRDCPLHRFHTVCEGREYFCRGMNRMYGVRRQCLLLPRFCQVPRSIFPYLPDIPGRRFCRRPLQDCGMPARG